MSVNVSVATEIIEADKAPLIGNAATRAFLNTYYAQELPLRPYLVFACLFYAFSFAALIFYQNLFPFDTSKSTKQVIDIELVSQADYKDTKDLLPATMPKPSLGKRSSPKAESRGDLFVPPTFVIRSAARAPETSKAREQVVEPLEQPMQANSWHEIVVEKHIPKELPKLSDRYMPLSVPISSMQSKISAIKRANKADVDLSIEEVKPPELVEVKENDGDNSYELWQDGGRSTSGSGAYSSLSSYLKNLHRKLKQYWVPPKGTAKNIKVIFRLSREGNLITIKLVRSSGNNLADTSALSAIREAAPFGKLPLDYGAPYLDLAYTFNYTSDELSEIKDSNQE